MKKRCSCFLRMQLSAGMPVLAAACLTAAGVAYGAEAAPAAKTPAVAPAISATELAKERSREIEFILEKIKKAELLAKEGDFNGAIASLDSAEADLNGKKVDVKGRKSVLPYLQEVEKRLQADRKEIGMQAGESLLANARKSFEKAISLGVSEEAAELAKSAKDMAANARFYYYCGNTSAKVGDYSRVEAAINPRNVDFSVRVEKLNQACDKVIASQEFRSMTDVAVIDQNFDARQREISELYVRAQKLYKAKQYTKARDLCEAIFIKDPYNQKAVELLNKVYKQMYFYSELRNYNELLRNDAEAIWSWVPTIRENTAGTTQVNSRRFSDPLMEKLSTWKISVDFKDYDVISAINKIRELSKKEDPARIGVNFLPRGIAGSPTENVRITLQLDNTPISVVLNYLCKKAGISWTTDKETFVHIGNGIGDFEDREIPMPNSIYQRITGKDGSEEESSNSGGQNVDNVWNAGGGGIAAGVEAGVTKRAKATDEDLRNFFVERGIRFDEGSSIAYDSRTHMLSVCNTRENLQKLEILVHEMDVDNPMVLIESKLLEIDMNDQEELGFDWTVEYTNDKNSAYNFAMQSPLRESGITNNKLLNRFNIIPNANFNGGHQLNLYLTLTAVDRTDRVEILSTPKVVSKNGEEATIKMVNQMYFPDSWSEPDTSNVNGTSFEFEPSYPEFGEATDVGITFTVTPTVSSNNKVITLQLLPSVTDLTGWSDYNYDVVLGGSYETEFDAASGGLSQKLKSTTSRITMKMPEISKREISTQLKVFDGQSVLMGGMTVDLHTTMEDRFPILGDIPILGRIFSKNATTTTRSSLLISVSTRLVNPDGKPRNANIMTGLPDFRR